MFWDIAEFNITHILNIRNGIKKGGVHGPIIYITGVPLVPPNGNPFYLEPLKLPAATDSQTAVTHIHYGKIMVRKKEGYVSQTAY
jgi:hypothetical protein